MAKFYGKRKYGGGYSRYQSKKRTAGRFKRGRMSRRPRRRTGTSYFKGKKTIYATKRARYTLKKPPVIRGTPHRSEFHARAFSSDGLNNPIVVTLNEMSTDRMFGDSSIDTHSYYINHDAYKLAFPTGMRKLYLKAVKMIVRLTNVHERNVTIRMSIISSKISRADADWNSDPHRPINTRHYKVHSSEKFVMNAGEYTTDLLGIAGAHRQAMITKTFYLPINQWRYTTHGDISADQNDWSHPNVFTKTRLRIDTDDITDADGQYIDMDFNATVYWYSVNDDQT